MYPFVRDIAPVFRHLLLSGIFLAFVTVATLGAGELDPSFTASAFGTLNGNVYVVEVLPDGKLMIGGHFTEVDGFAASGIARLNSDGSVDRTFKSPDLFGSALGSQVNAIAFQSDGKIIVGGATILGANGVFNPGLRRLNTDGSLDTSFAIVTLDGPHRVYDVEVQSDDKIVMGGEFNITGPSPTAGIARLNADGTRDTSFAPNFVQVRDIEIQPDGKILITDGGSVRRLTATGAADPSFTVVSTSSAVFALKLKTNGQILIGGSFQQVNTFTQRHLSLINSDGSLDTSFNLNNLGPDSDVRDIELRPDGKILIGGSFSSYNATSRQKIAQLNADGSIDSAFQTDGTLSPSFINDVAILPDGRLLVAMFGGLKRFNATGTADASFVTYITRSGRVRKILEQPDGKILVAGEFPRVNGIKRTSLARLNSDGSVDTTFTPFFNDIATGIVVYAVAIQPDGKILFGSDRLSIKRLNTDGTDDTTFASDLPGVATDIVLLSNGNILAAGSFFPSSGSGARRVVRFSSNGTYDPTFAAVQPNNAVNRILVQPDGQIVIGGDFTQIGSLLRGRIARLNGVDGSLDTSFNPPGGASGSVQELDLQSDGKIVLGGGFGNVNGNTNHATVGRLLPNGSVDTTFASQTNGGVWAIRIQPNGKILIGGSFSGVQGVPHNGIARLNPDGSVDNSFNTFANTYVWDINLQSDGKILVGGEFTKINGISAVRIARLMNTQGGTVFDYDGDGRSDVSVFRPSENKWYVLRSSDSQVDQPVFGLPGDILTPADYDGDGKTDLAIFRPSSGQWWYRSSVNGSFIANTFGQSGDVPRPSDFDGDGKADLVLFRPSNSTWYRFGTLAGHVANAQFGIPGDQPVIGDFDGDGRSDLAIFRPSNGDWWYAASSAGGAFRNVHWGQNGDLPVPADYDGDSKTDFAVFRPSDGGWYIYNSGNGSFTTTAFGTSGDRPVAGDYDGDGRADIAVFRPSTGVWYLLQSTSGFAGAHFGISTDTPTPSAFVP